MGEIPQKRLSTRIKDIVQQYCRCDFVSRMAETYNTLAARTSSDTMHAKMACVGRQLELDPRVDPIIRLLRGIHLVA